MKLSIEDQIMINQMILSGDKVFKEVIPQRLFLYPYSAKINVAPIELEFYKESLMNGYDSVTAEKYDQIGSKDYLYLVYAQKIGYKDNPMKLYYIDKRDNRLLIINENLIDRNVVTMFDKETYYCTSSENPISGEMIYNNSLNIKKTNLFLHEEKEVKNIENKSRFTVHIDKKIKKFTDVFYQTSSKIN